MTTIGENIQQYARVKKIPLRQLARECGINYNTLYAFVSRKSNKVTIDNLNKLAKALGVSTDALTNPNNPVIECSATAAEIKLSTTIRSIIGCSEGKDREKKLSWINSFLETNSNFFEYIFDQNIKGEKS